MAAAVAAVRMTTVGAYFCQQARLNILHETVNDAW
jgi:hypothetical protein